MTKFLFLWGLAALTAVEANARANVCVDLGEASGAKLSRCVSDRGEEEFLVSMQSDAGNVIEVHAMFGNGLAANSFSRIWEKTGSQRLSAENQRALRQLLANKGRGDLGDRGFALVNFLANFAPVGFELRSYEPSVPSPSAQFTSICNKFGQWNTGYFNVGRGREKRRGIVGYPDCLGRCGEGCGGSRNPKEGKYTQECFNHDLCNRTTGENMGVCEDSFWSAADGFLNAPECD
ncbi:MAG: hypothetical protein ACXVBE_13995 [Bdellovibrionota bacterium]